MSRPKPSGRSYGRLTRHERNTVERMLDLNRSAREIAAELGRSPSTVTREVAAHRYVTAPRSRYGEPAPADLSGACPRLSAWPRCCNGCSHRRGYGCSRRPRVFYSARRAQEAADAELSGSRSGIDETEEGAAAKLAAIRDGLARGLSPQQIAATAPGLSASTVYRWVDAGYDGMTNMELRRKVGYRPRSRRAPGRATSHSARRSHASFLALGEDACAAAWEMDTVEGARGDSARLLTLPHRPSRFQLALPLPDGTCASVLAALSSLRGVLGEDGARRAFGAVLADNGSEFGLATLVWTVPGGAQETGGPYMRDPRHPRHFTDEFKRQIVDLYNAGKPKREIMDEYDLGKSTVERWIKSINATGSPHAADNRTPEQNRILELERENRRLRMEVDVLKQAALIYARK